MPLLDFINKYYGGNQSAFARANNINNRQQVNRMIKKGYIVVDWTLYSPRCNVAVVNYGS